MRSVFATCLAGNWNSPSRDFSLSAAHARATLHFVGPHAGRSNKLFLIGLLGLLALGMVACEGGKDGSTANNSPQSSKRILDPNAPTGNVRYVSQTDLGKKQLGVPAYPGATRLDGGKWEMSDSLAEGAQSLTSLIVISRDSIERVAQFYRKRLGPNMGESFEADTASGHLISMTAEYPDHSSTNVLLNENKAQGHTQIQITRMAGPSGKPISQVQTTSGKTPSPTSHPTP